MDAGSTPATSTITTLRGFKTPEDINFSDRIRRKKSGFDGGDTAFDRAYGSKIDNSHGSVTATKVNANDDNFVEDMALAA